MRLAGPAAWLIPPVLLLALGAAGASAQTPEPAEIEIPLEGPLR